MKKLGFGTMRLPLFDSENPKSIDLEQVKLMVDEYMAKGFVYFDTAYPYHEETSELAVKEALVKRYPRESFVLADKMPIIRVTSSEDYERYFNEQLDRCGVTYFDYYLLHNMGRDRYINTKRYGGFEFVSELKKKGLVKHIGFSFHDDADTLDMILSEQKDVDFVQLQVNYLDWDSAVAQSGRCIEVAKKYNKPVIVMEPVKGGTLANLPEVAAKEFKEFYKDEAVMPSPASLAVRFAASTEQVFMVLSGMSDIAQLRDNVSYMEEFKPLSDEEKKLVNRISDIMNDAIKIQCTSCKYCMEECPKNINIPAYFGLINLHAITGKKTGMYYKRFAMNHGLASECIGCGRCEKICPQHIEIRKWLKEMVNLYETE